MQTNPLGQVKTNSFDNDGRLTKMSYAAMAPVSYGYDPRGLVTLIQDQVGSTTNTWDACGQLTLRQSFFGSETMQYDPVGNRTLYQSTSGVRYTSAYDAVNRETTLTFGSKVHSAQYDKVGNPTTETYSSGTQVRRGYDSRGYMTTLVQNRVVSGVVTYVNTWDEGGRKTLSVRNGVATTNTYDDDDRLTLQNRPSFVASFAYDQDTNLTSSHHQGSNPITFTNNSFGQVVTQIQGSTLTTNTWDNTGRNTGQVTGSVTINRTWDQENRLVLQQSAPINQPGEFLYRHDNLRVQSSINNVASAQYVWDSGDIRRIIGSQGNDFAIFNGQIVEGVLTEYLSDEFGHITGWYQEETISYNDLEYWPYGDVQSGTLPPEGLGYMGAYSATRKPFIDLVYAQQRWLKPSVGRFLALDPIWPYELAYMYADGGATISLDPDGTFPRPGPWACWNEEPDPCKKFAGRGSRKISTPCGSIDLPRGINHPYKGKDPKAWCCWERRLRRAKGGFTYCMSQTAGTLATIQIWLKADNFPEKDKIAHCVIGCYAEKAVDSCCAYFLAIHMENKWFPPGNHDYQDYRATIEGMRCGETLDLPGTLWVCRWVSGLKDIAKSVFYDACFDCCNHKFNTGVFKY